MYEHFQEPAAYAVNLFGGPTLLSSRRAVRLSPTQGYLVAIVFGSLRANIPRARVRSLLWEEDDDSRSRRRLSQLLYQTNQRVGDTPLILSEDDQLIPNSEFTRCDLASFQGMLREGRLQSANLLLRAGFLGNLDQTPTREFEDWLDARRVALRSTLRDAAAAAWSDCERLEQWHEARVAAEVLSDLDPTEEVALRHVMWARAMTGAVQEAVAAYQSFSERAQASEDGERWFPSSESEAIYRKIRGLRDSEGATVVLKDSEEDLDPPLCGRNEELSRLSRCLATMPQGALSTILVSGEGGIGKTRLVEEALKSAPLRGVRVFSAQSAEFERPIPLNPLLDALDHPEVEGALARLGNPWRTVLLALMPQFHRGEGPVPEAPYVQPDSVPRRLFEAFHHLFSELVGEGPVLLFLDDFQWADDTTLAVLQFLQRRWQAGRLILLMAYRPESRYVEQESVARFLKTVREGKRVEEIHLDDLTPAASGDLVAAVATAEISERDLNSLCALGGNNPFFLIELTVEHLAGRLNTDLHDRDLILLPQSIRQILTRRFSELSADADTVLALLAVIGRPIDFREISAITRQPEESSIIAVEQLLRFRLVQRVTLGLRVRHELIRQAVYGGLSESRQAWLHERVADYLLETDDPPPIDQLAVHFHKAKVEDQALHYSTRAADAAEVAGAVPEAIRYLKIAREHAHDPEVAAEITGKLGHLHYLHLNYGEAVPLLEFASSRLRTQNRLAEALKYDVERADAISHGKAPPIRDVLDDLQRIKSEAKSHGLWDVLTKALDVEIHILDRVTDVQAVQSTLQEAEDLLDAPDPRARCSAHSILALHLFFGSPKKALASARTAVQLAEKYGLRQQLLQASNRLLINLIQLGRLTSDEGRIVVARAQALAGESGDLGERFNLHANVACFYMDTGDYDHAYHSFSQAERILTETEDKSLWARHHYNLGELGLYTREETQARDHFSQAFDHLGSNTPEYLRDMVQAGLGLTALTTGDLRTAREMEEQVGSLPDYWSFDPYLLVTFKARMSWHQGDRRSAILLLKQTGEAVRGRLVTCWLKLRLEESRLLRRVDMSEARQVAEEALGVASDLGLRVRIREFQLLTG